MKRTLLLCAIYVFVLLKGKCAQNKEARDALQREVNGMIVKHTEFVEQYEEYLRRLYCYETRHLKDALDLLLNNTLPYRRQVKVTKEVDIQHCLKNFRNRMNTAYNAALSNNDACVILYTNITALQPMELKIMDLKMKLDELCSVDHLAEPTEELGSLQARYRRLSWQLYSCEDRLMNNIEGAVKKYKERFAKHVAQMSKARESYEREAIRCIKKAIRDHNKGAGEGLKFESL